MPNNLPMSEHEQFCTLNVLDFVADLFSSSMRMEFTVPEILVILDYVRSHEELFDRDVVIAQQEVTRHIGT